MPLKKKTRRGLAAIVIIALSAIGFSVFSLMRRPAPSINPANIKLVERGDIALSVVATGVIEPISNRIEIRSKASGIVKKIHADAGDSVVPGQILVELDKDQLLAQLREAEANLQAAKADVVAARAELSRNRILAEDYDVNLARANHNRSMELLQQNLISQSVFDETKNRLDAAVNRQRAALTAIEVAEASIVQREARVLQVQAMVDRIREDLENASIRSPIRGIVLSRDVETGSAVSSILTMGAGATRVMVLGDMSEVYVRGQVNEIDIGKIRVGLPARISVETFKDKKFQGSVYRIAPLGFSANNVTSFEVRISVENPEGLLRANMSANAEIILEEHRDVLTIPEGALIYGEDGKPFVEVPDTGSQTGRRRVAVDLGISTGIRAEILSGVDAGDAVILQ
jgi:HlyD family secretion protein